MQENYSEMENEELLEECYYAYEDMRDYVNRSD